MECFRCGFDKNKESATHCAACGEELKKITTQVNHVNTITQLLGFAELRGKIINIDPTYFQPPDFNWNKVILLLLLSPFIIIGSIIILGFLIVTQIILSILRVQINLLSIFSGLFGIIINALKVIIPKTSRQEIPVKDIILQDSDGKYLVRIKGHIRIGSVSIGDNITVKGRVKRGTFFFRSGYNHSINSDLKLQKNYYNLYFALILLVYLLLLYIVNLSNGI